MTTQPTRVQTRRRIVFGVVRGLTVLGLVGDALVHLHLASNYQQSAPQGLGGGTLFRLEAVVAIAAAVYVMVRDSRRSYAVAFLVAVSALGAVLVYRYVDLPAFGPLPAMYEPVWFAEKSLSAVAEALGAVAACCGLMLTVRPPSRDH